MDWSSRNSWGTVQLNELCCKSCVVEEGLEAYTSREGKTLSTWLLPAVLGRMEKAVREDLSVSSQMHEEFSKKM